MMSICYFKFVFVFLLSTNQLVSGQKTILDYTLYSQLIKDVQDFNENNYELAALNESVNLESAKKFSVVDYFKVFNDKIEKYNEYLYFPDEERIRLKNLAKDMFEFGYDNYMKHAFPKDELDPIHCTGRGPDYNNPGNINVNDALGDYLLTLVDSLSSLAVFGNATEFKKASRLVIDHLNFDKNNTVQVFEATIRYLLFSKLINCSFNLE